MCLNSVFTQTTYTQDRFRHVHQMEIVPFRLTTNLQPDLSFPELLERFSVCTSETSRTIRLLQFGFPKPPGTHVDRERLRGRSSPDLHGFLGPNPWLFVHGFLGPNPWLFVHGFLGPNPWLFVHGFLGPNPWLFFFLQFCSLRNHYGSDLRH